MRALSNNKRQWEKISHIVCDSFLAVPRALDSILYWVLDEEGDTLFPQTIPEEGRVVSWDPEKMKKVNEAIKKHEEEGSTGHIIVKF